MFSTLNPLGRIECYYYIELENSLHLSVFTKFNSYAVDLPAPIRTKIFLSTNSCKSRVVVDFVVLFIERYFISSYTTFFLRILHYVQNDSVVLS